MLWIEPALPAFEANNDSNRQNTQVDEVRESPYGLDGSGVTVMVYDGGYADASHPDFGGRLTVRDSSGQSSHATHVSGTIGGDGANSGGVNAGMAPGVEIQSYGFEQEGGLSEGFLYTDPGDLEADYSDAILNYGAVVANNSIGTNTAPNGFPCDWTGNYGGHQQLDRRRSSGAISVATSASSGQTATNGRQIVAGSSLTRPHHQRARRTTSRWVRQIPTMTPSLRSPVGARVTTAVSSQTSPRRAVRAMATTE